MPNLPPTNSKTGEESMWTVSHARGTLPACCFAAPHHWTCSSKKHRVSQRVDQQDDRQRPNVEKRHLVLQAFLHNAARNSLNCTPTSLDCRKVRHNTVCVRSRHRPFDDNLVEGDRAEQYRTCQTHRVRSRANPGMVLSVSALLSQASSESSFNAS